MHGRCWMCCSMGYFPFIGNVLEDSVEEIWNGRRVLRVADKFIQANGIIAQHWSCP